MPHSPIEVPQTPPSAFDDAMDGADDAAALRKLARIIRNHDAFALLFCVVVGFEHRKRLVERFEQENPDLRLLDIRLWASEGRFLSTMERELRRDSATTGSLRPDAVFAWGMEGWMGDESTARRSRFILGLNRNRNSLHQRVSCPLVFWCAPHILAAIQGVAPDFFSIRTSVLYFSSGKTGESFHEAAITSDGLTAALGIGIAEREIRIAEYRARRAALLEIGITPDNADAYSRILTQLVEYLDAAGNYSDAVGFAEEDLRLNEATLGAQHPSTATSLNNLAGLYESTGNYAAALPLYERALAITGGNSGRTASRYGGIAQQSGYVVLIHGQR